MYIDLNRVKTEPSQQLQFPTYVLNTKKFCSKSNRNESSCQTFSLISVPRIGWEWKCGFISTETVPWLFLSKWHHRQQKKHMFSQTSALGCERQVTASGPPNSWSMQTSSRHRGKYSKNEEIGCSNKMHPLRQTTIIISNTTLSDATKIENNFIMQPYTHEIKQNSN